MSETLATLGIMAELKASLKPLEYIRNIIIINDNRNIVPMDLEGSYYPDGKKFQFVFYCEKLRLYSGNKDAS